MHFKLDYNFQSMSLSVTVYQCTELPSANNSGKCDSNVKLVLHPDKTKKFETKVLRGQSSPAFNETFVFKVRGGLSSLEGRNS